MRADPERAWLYDLRMVWEAARVADDGLESTSIGASWRRRWRGLISDIGELEARVAEGEARRSRAGHLPGGVRGSCASIWPGSMGSLSWRATAPVRLAAARARALRGRE